MFYAVQLFVCFYVVGKNTLGEVNCKSQEMNKLACLWLYCGDLY
jgi:hypothetical protein